MPSKLSNLLMWLSCFSLLFGFVLLGYSFYQHYTELGLFTLTVSFIVSLFLFGMSSRIKRNNKHKQLEFLQTFQPDRADFHKLKSFTSNDLLTKIAIDPKQQKIYLWVPNTNKSGQTTKAFSGMSYTIKTYDFSDLLAIKYIENDYEMAFVQKDTHYTNFLLNKMREEETAPNRSTQPPIDKVQSIDLEMIVSDIKTPIHRFRFYNLPYRQLQKDSPQYAALQKEFYKWFNQLKEIIYDAEQNVESSAGTIDNTAKEKKTKITMDINAIQPSLHLKEGSPTTSEKESETIEEELKQEVTTPNPTSYFEQIVEKNRRQMRGEYRDDR